MTTPPVPFQPYHTAWMLEEIRAINPALAARFDRLIAQLLSRDPAQVAAAMADLQRLREAPDALLDPVAQDAEAEAQALLAQIAALHRQLRAFLAALTALGAPPEHLATALGYELVSLAAGVSDTPEEAQAHLANFLDAAHAQIADHGVGHPHPGLDETDPGDESDESDPGDPGDAS